MNITLTITTDEKNIPELLCLLGLTPTNPAPQMWAGADPKAPVLPFCVSVNQSQPAPIAFP